MQAAIAGTQVDTLQTALGKSQCPNHGHLLDWVCFAESEKDWNRFRNDFMSEFLSWIVGELTSPMKNLERVPVSDYTFQIFFLFTQGWFASTGGRRSTGSCFHRNQEHKQIIEGMNMPRTHGSLGPQSEAVSARRQPMRS